MLRLAVNAQDSWAEIMEDEEEGEAEDEEGDMLQRRGSCTRV